MLRPAWLTSGPVAQILATLTGAGHAAFVVGGAVRDSLLGGAPEDIDIATSAHPEAVTHAFEDRARVVPTGVEHGTVTVVLAGRAIEVTTFRRDVATDGRHAKVDFTAKVDEDARRRDFTFNALYLDSEGRILDPTGGLADLRAGRVRFIGDAAARIREDYLRSLRYFRFFARFGDQTRGHDPTALDAIVANLDGIAGLPAERVTDEVRKLLAAPEPDMALAGMQTTGLLAKVLPGAALPATFELLHLEKVAGVAPDPLLRLACLGGWDGLRLSRAEARRLKLLTQTRGSETGLSEIAWRHGAEIARDTALLRAAGLSEPLAPGALDEIEKGATARLPLSAADLMPELEGETLGRALAAAERHWIDSGFTASRDRLIEVARKRG